MNEGKVRIIFTQPLPLIAGKQPEHGIGNISFYPADKAREYVERGVARYLPEEENLKTSEETKVYQAPVVQPPYKRFQPMSPAQLDALRPKPAGQQPAVNEASAIAYKTGIRELAPLVLRLISAESTIAEQAVQIAALQSTVLKLKHGK